MNTRKETILVTGATGQQGGSVARHLLNNRWQVRAFVRDVNKDSTHALVTAGAELVQGDLEDRASLDRALEGVYGVFSFPNMAGGLESEVSQGKRVADAAKTAGVQHFVQSSVGGVERNSGVPHFESKWKIENYVRELGLPATFLRPVYFMDNLNWQRQQILEGTLTSMGMNGDKPVQLIAVHDIGAFAAMMFDQPQKFIGEGVELAGDELTESQIAAAFGKVIGKTVALVQPDGPPAYEDMAIMVDWFNEYGYQADIPALRTRLPGLLNFESWLRKSGW
jgi:uncharacterized protein YbjT (DUF2867 family)